MNIKILGSGCTNCKKLYNVTKEVIESLKINAVIEKIENMEKIMNYPIIKTPVLVINEKVVLQGKIPNVEELKKIIEKVVE